MTFWFSKIFKDNLRIYLLNKLKFYIWHKTKELTVYLWIPLSAHSRCISPEPVQCTPLKLSENAQKLTDYQQIIICAYMCEGFPICLCNNLISGYLFWEWPLQLWSLLLSYLEFHCLCKGMSLCWFNYPEGVNGTRNANYGYLAIQWHLFCLLLLSNRLTKPIQSDFPTINRFYFHLANSKSRKGHPGPFTAIW